MDYSQGGGPLRKKRDSTRCRSYAVQWMLSAIVLVLMQSLCLPAVAQSRGSKSTSYKGPAEAAREARQRRNEARKSEQTYTNEGLLVEATPEGEGDRSQSTDTLQVVKENQAPVVEAGPNQTITLPSVVSLIGSVADDGLPEGSLGMTTLWMQISGPSSVAFADPLSSTTVASFPLAGTYVLRLSANDGVLEVTDEVTIEVLDTAQSELEAEAAEVEDAAVDFSSVYSVLQPAGDGQSQKTDKGRSHWRSEEPVITITETTPDLVPAATEEPAIATSESTAEEEDPAVEASTAVSNSAPLVRAGPDQTITFPENARVNGSVTDKSVPAANGLTVAWRKLTGPGQAMFVDVSSAETSVSFSEPGSYLLRLWASDGELTSADDVVITVSPTPVPEPSSKPELSTGKTVYVSSNNGSDENSGTEDSPYRTIKKGLESVSAGDTVMIREGMYEESVNSLSQEVPSGTSYDNAVRIRAYPEETVILRPTNTSHIIELATPVSYTIWQDLILDGDLVTDNGIKLNGGANHNRFVNLEIRDVPTSGVQQGGAAGGFDEFINLNVHHIGRSGAGHGLYLTKDENLVDGGEYHDIGFDNQFGIQIFNSGGGPQRNTIRNVEIYNNQKGMELGSGSGHLAYNNLIRNNRDLGVNLGRGPGSGSRFFNNVVYGTAAGYGLQIHSTAQNTEVKNNILWNNAYNAINDLGTNTIKAANLAADPLFMDPVEKDFRPKDGSPVVDAGVDVDDVDADMDGVPRPQGAAIDIGAYEYQGTSTEPDLCVGYICSGP